MWTNKRSILLTIICTVICMATVVALAVIMPTIANWYTQAVGRPDSAATLLITFYGCLLPVMAALVLLLLLLFSLLSGQVFTSQNVAYLRYLSWSLFLVSLILAVGAIWYPTFLLLAMVCAFIGLIVRVVKNIMATAMQIKQENELTI